LGGRQRRLVAHTHALTHIHTRTLAHSLREADLRQASKHLTVVVECWRFNVAKTDSWSTTLLPLLPVIVVSVVVRVVVIVVVVVVVVVGDVWLTIFGNDVTKSKSEKSEI